MKILGETFRDLSEEHESFRASARMLLKTELARGADTRAILAQAGVQGFLGIAVPTAFEGAGIDDVRFGLLFVEAAMEAGATAVALRYFTHAWLAAPLLAHFGTKMQKAASLPAMASGTGLATVAGLSTRAGDPVSLQAESTGDRLRMTGGFVDVLGAADADFLLAVAYLDGAPMLASFDAHMLTIDRVEDGTAAPGLGTADITVGGVSTLSESGHRTGLPAALARLQADYDLCLAFAAVTGARAALHETAEYVRQRTVFGRRLATFENTRHAMAEVAVELAAATSLVADCVRDRVRDELDPVRASLAALAAAAVHVHSADQGLQLHGGYGYMREYAIAGVFADAASVRAEVGGGMVTHDQIATAIGM